jgi:hypothetical protein
VRALIASLDFLSEFELERLSEFELERLSEFELERLSEFEQRGDYTSGRPRTV